MVMDNEWGGLCAFSRQEGRGRMDRGVRVENGWGGGMSGVGYKVFWREERGMDKGVGRKNGWCGRMGGLGK